MRYSAVEQAQRGSCQECMRQPVWERSGVIPVLKAADILTAWKVSLYQELSQLFCFPFLRKHCQPRKSEQSVLHLGQSWLTNQENVWSVDRAVQYHFVELYSVVLFLGSLAVILNCVGRLFRWTFLCKWCKNKLLQERPSMESLWK